MNRLLSYAFAALIAFGVTGILPVRADDKKTPDQIKQEKKDKDLKKAKEDMEKDLKAKKIDPSPALAMLDKLATQVGLDVAPAKDLVHKIIGKKIPWDQANTASDDKLRGSVDSKTNKIDTKKFTTDYTKWISDWKPEPAAAKPADPPKK